MIPEFNGEGNLPPGIYTPNLPEFKSRFVLSCANSKTRRSIYSNYIGYCKEIIAFDIASKNWVDGSFTTKKEDPGDIDIVVHFDALKLNSIQERDAIISRLLHRINTKHIFNCHTFPVPVYPPHDRRRVQTQLQSKKWEKWFSQDKVTKKPKGLIEFDLSNSEHKQNVIIEGEKHGQP
jgi:hypothetical protein